MRRSEVADMFDVFCSVCVLSRLMAAALFLDMAGAM